MPEPSAADRVANAQSGQKRGRSIMLTPTDLDGVMERAPLCRVVTSGRDGRAHVTPLWFVWTDARIWAYSLVNTRRWRDLLVSSDVTVLVDVGESFAEFAGIEVTGQGAPAGQVPHTTLGDPAVAAAEVAFGRKYLDGEPLVPDGRHAWIRVEPESIVTWDFAKLAK